MKPMLDIREIGDDDIEAVTTLWERCGLTRPWNDPCADISFALSSPSAAILGGWLNHELAASAMVGHDGHRGTVYYVSVNPDRRRDGLGREIMEAAEDWLRCKGIWKLNLIVPAGNEAVTRFYHSIGYEREERINMAKWIDPSRKPS